MTPFDDDVRAVPEIVRLGLVDDVFDVRGHAVTELGAIAGLRAAAREMVANGRRLSDLVGLVATDGEMRLVARSVIQAVSDLGMVERGVPLASTPAGVLLVVSESDGEPRFQFIEVM